MRLDLKGPGLGGNVFDKRRSRKDNASKERDLTIKKKNYTSHLSKRTKMVSWHRYKANRLWKGHVNQIHETDNSTVQIVAPIQNLQ